MRKIFAELRKVADLLPGNVYFKDAAGYYLGCNKRNAKVLGVPSPDDIIGKNIFEILGKEHHELAKAVDDIDNQIMRDKTEKTFEEQGLDLDGYPAIYLTKKSPLFNSKGKVIGLIGVSIDITSHKKYEKNLVTQSEQMKQQLHDNSALLDNILSNLPLTLYWMDLEGKILACNTKQANVFGLDIPEQMVGKNIYEVAKMLGWDRKMADKIRKNDLSIIKTREPQHLEETVFLNGEQRIYYACKYPLLNKENEVIGVFGFGIDITERKHFETELQDAKQRAESANQLKSQFIANMGHDLRTPFSGILTLSEYLLNKETDSIKIEMLTDVVNSAKSLLALLNQILEVSALGKQLVQIAAFNLKEVVNEIINLMRAELKVKGLQLIVECPDIMIWNDKLRISRILLNLVSNAVKFTENGAIHIEINVKNEVCIKVSDTGSGIPKESLETIFDKFVKLNPAYGTNEFTGAGLGLFIVKQFVSDLGGNIQVESELGKGSSFICTVPLQINHHLEKQQA
jgi:two-component system aerobic respiration control sensor histidine kinase ArcB